MYNIVFILFYFLLAKHTFLSIEVANNLPKVAKFSIACIQTHCVNTLSDRGRRGVWPFKSEGGRGRGELVTR